MVADPGDYSGEGEDALVSGLLQDPMAIPPDQTMCAKLLFGTLMGTPVLSATTGIGE